MTPQEKIGEPFEDDDIDDEENGMDEPDYYYCCGCRFSTTIDYGGWGCPQCGAIMEPENY